MTYNYSKLKGRIVEKYNSNARFADKVGVSNVYLSGILNNKRGLTRDNIVKWSDALDIDKTEIGEYFFNVEV